jgi:redox-sensitive bicupin YhaK (pirin superfamily)
MIALRRAEARGHFEFGWLDTFHTFSFGEYYDPAQMGFRALRVLNEDRVQPGRGFPTHGHRDMEIVSYVLEGVPDRRGYEPSYEQRTIPDTDKRGAFRPLAGSPGSGALVSVHQDVRLYSLSLERDQEVVYELRPDRHAWVQMARGAVTLDGQPLWQSDGAAVSEQSSLRLIGIESAELLVFDLS